VAAARHRLITRSVGPLLALLLAVPLGAPRAEPQAVGPPGLWTGLDPTFGPLFGRRPTGIVLQRVPGPDTDTIRWVSSARSVGRTANLDEHRRLVRLDRFGRKVDYELRAALRRAQALVLDLRGNRGGSLSRMLRVAARFTGPVPDAVRLVRADDLRLLSIPTPEGALWRGPITVLVGPDTMSSGEVLAALLRRYADATVLGERTFGKDYALRIEPIAQGWRALIPDGRLEVSGEILAGGLAPDGPIPAALAASLPTD
jgi:C-terminal processing protease CtpA/Prc